MSAASTAVVKIEKRKMDPEAKSARRARSYRPQKSKVIVVREPAHYRDGRMKYTPPS